jgi:hypothetical protein
MRISLSGGMLVGVKIPQDLPQFSRQAALILALGWQEAVLYHAVNGRIELVEKLKEARPAYSDKEGHFKTRSHGKVIRSGAPRELPKEIAARDLWHRLVAVLKKQRGDGASLLVSCPPQHKNYILAKLPSRWRGRLAALVPGNITHWHPLEIIKRFGRFADRIPPAFA